MRRRRCCNFSATTTLLLLVHDEFIAHLDSSRVANTLLKRVLQSELQRLLFVHVFLLLF